jgi:hypothetical protein
MFFAFCLKLLFGAIFHKSTTLKGKIPSLLGVAPELRVAVAGMEPRGDCPCCWMSCSSMSLKFVFFSTAYVLTCSVWWLQWCIAISNSERPVAWCWVGTVLGYVLRPIKCNSIRYRDKRVLSFTKPPGRFWGSFSLLSSGWKGSFPKCKAAGTWSWIFNPVWSQS